MEEIVIPRDNEKDLRFTGELVAEVQSSANNASTRYSGSTGRWTVLKLYKTKAGKFVCQSIGRTQWDKETDRYSGAACTTHDEVTAFFGHGWLAKELYGEAGIDDAETIE